MPVFLVAVAQAQVEDGGGGVAELCGEGRGEEVGVREGFVVDDGHGTPAGTRYAEVIGVGQVYPFDAPEYAGRAVASDDDVVAGVVRALDAGEVAGHPRRIASGSCVAVGFFDCEGAGGDGGHFVEDLAFFGGGDFGGLHGHHALRQFDFEHGGSARVDDHPVKGADGIAHEAYAELVSAHGNVKGEAPVHVGGGGRGFGCQELDGGPGQGKPRLSVDDGAGDATRWGLRESRTGEQKEKEGEHPSGGAPARHVANHVD